MSLPAYDYRSELRLLLSERQKRNSRYSLRAMAKDLQISVTALHGVINGERHLSRKNLELIAQRLEWTTQKLEMALHCTHTIEDPTETLMTEDQFRLMADWLHLAILNLSRIKNVKVASLPQRLGLSEQECQAAVDRLIRLGLLKVKDHCLQRVAPSFGTSNDVPSAAIRAFHHNNLVRTQKALEDLPVEDRHFLTVAAASNKEQLRELKKKIEEFRKDALNTLTTNSPDQVYFLNIQLFPVTKGEEI